MRQQPINAVDAPSPARRYAAGAIILACAAVLAWVYWPRAQSVSPDATSAQQRAEQIAEEIRRKEQPPPEAPSQSEQAAAGSAGPVDMRAKARGK